ncbi:MAG: 30S ribosomal protein S1 [Candidatus Solincola sediminis]|uniref:30S ribosomal protein S1 n=1 Tax=Candidatus Solincola sediminis TaxID=1797199 RepID=A0A1F2WGG7_9ACTN|nr:MAG: 30S ribosomal protein S1 [Candidatus Solincola sediminis]
MLDQSETERDLVNPENPPVLSAPLTNFDYSEGEVPNYDKTIKIFSEGDIIAGIVVKVDKDEVLLDIGYKSEGVIPARELSIRYGVKTDEVVKVGDEIDALVLQKEDKEGRLILSKKRAQYERSWDVLEKNMLESDPIEGEVIEVVKGGLILDIGLRGFLPASLIDIHRVKELHSFLQTKLVCKIIEMDRNRNNVVLSRRAFLEETASERRKVLLENLEKGMKVSGKVSSIVSFGAFVNLGGIDGLIHISELSWCHVEKPSEVLSVGDEVDVEILEVDKERERISLSLKACQADPWEQLARDVEVGEVIKGMVTKLVPFGAFVQVRPGIEGLVHISELSRRHVEQPDEVVVVNQDIEVKVIDIDIDRRRISLSLKQTLDESDEEFDGEAETVETESIPEEATETVPEEATETVLEPEEAATEIEVEVITEEMEEAAAVDTPEPAESVTEELEEAIKADIEDVTVDVVVEAGVEEMEEVAEAPAEEEVLPVPQAIIEEEVTVAVADKDSEASPAVATMTPTKVEESVEEADAATDEAEEEEEPPEGSLESIIRDMKRDGV